MNAQGQQIVSNFDKMITLSQEQVNRLNDQIAALSNMRDSLEQIIAVSADTITHITSGKYAIFDKPEEMTPPKRINLNFPSRDVPTQFTEPLWKRIERLMSTHTAFTMKQAGEALEAELGRSLGKNRPQTVRNNLIRHKEAFRQNDDGSWTVITVAQRNEEEGNA